jgi:biopolymer transport protein ExbD
MNFQRGVQHEQPEISLIPLIDVVLVIIIFLMLTTTFTRVSGLQINLPTGDGEIADIRPEEISVAVTASGEILVNGLVVGGRDVVSIARALGQAVPAGDIEPIVVISADARASHQSVVDVMQAAQRASLPQITFAIQTPAD